MSTGYVIGEINGGRFLYAIEISDIIRILRLNQKFTSRD